MNTTKVSYPFSFRHFYQFSYLTVFIYVLCVRVSQARTGRMERSDMSNGLNDLRIQKKRGLFAFSE
jgi:hypothetical protein